MQSIILLLFTCVLFAMADAGHRVGGLGASKPADDHVKEAVRAVQSAIASSAKLDANSPLTPVTYGSQVVAGVNYFVKIRVGEGASAKYIHARIYRNLQGQHSLAGIQDNHTADDEITYFDQQ